MATENKTIHELTSAEIDRQIAGHNERRRQIVAERANMYAAALKNGVSAETPVVDADERAARDLAKGLLNGYAPVSLSLPPEITRDKLLYREQRGLEITLRILGDRSLVARAAAAVVWAEVNTDRWRALCRDITLTAIKLEALENSARQLIDQCVDIFAVRLPMTNVVGGRPISETPIRDLEDIALREGVVTQAEIKKAKKDVE